jgi:uncharacterized coiled-coil DUF342 family protein
MKFEEILKDFMILSARRSAQVKDVSDMQNDVVSISERIEELREARPRNTDEIAKARDKRKRVRADISTTQHSIRMVEAEIEALKMRFKWLVDYEANNEQD